MNTSSFTKGLKQHIIKNKYFFTRGNIKAVCFIFPKICFLQYFMLNKSTRKHFGILKTFGVWVWVFILRLRGKKKKRQYGFTYFQPNLNSLLEGIHSSLPLKIYCVQKGVTCWKYLSQLMYSLSWESCSLFVLMYCQRAWMMADRVCVCIPSKRASRGSSLNCGGCNGKRGKWQ